MRMLRTTDNRRVNGVYAGNNMIHWNQERGTPLILICMLREEIPRKERFSELLESIEGRLVVNQLLGEEGTPNSFLLFPTDFNRTSYPVKSSGVSVGVFAAEYDENHKLLVYCLNSVDELIDNFKFMKTTVKVECLKQSTETGSFIKKLIGKSEMVSYYRVKVSTQDAFEDGDVYYCMNGYTFPIPKNVVNKTFYLRVKHNDGLYFVAKDDRTTVNAPVGYTKP